MQMVTFHSVVRCTYPTMVYKGMERYSEMYGILEPEYNPKKMRNQQVVDVLGYPHMSWDKIVIGGEAGSHCVLESVKQIVMLFKSHPENLRRIYLLEDCISPVPGFERQMADAFTELQHQGINIVKSTDLVL